jgi:hypothetical protein
VQQFLSIPVYTIFKNMTIILIAYGEVVWFGGSVTALSLVSFALMVSTSEQVVGNGTDATCRSFRRSLLRRPTSQGHWGQLLQVLPPTRASDTSG